MPGPQREKRPNKDAAQNDVCADQSSNLRTPASLQPDQVTPPPLPSDVEREAQFQHILLASLCAVVLLVLLVLLLLWHFPSGDQPGEGGSGDGKSTNATGAGQGEDDEKEGGEQGHGLDARGKEGEAGTDEAAKAVPPGGENTDVRNQEDGLNSARQGSAQATSAKTSPEDGALVNDRDIMGEGATPEDQGSSATEAERLPEIDSQRNKFFTLGDERGPPIEGVLGGRNKHAREALVHKGGGTKGSEEAVWRALKWLAAHQGPDGSWSFQHDHGPCKGRCRDPGSLKLAQNGATAMALLPFLGAGQTHREGEFRGHVGKGLHYLRQSMIVTEDGGSLVDQGNLYSHGLAAITLSEAYAMTQDPKLAMPAQRSLDYVMFAQDPVGGGWRYRARQRGDTSVVGWQIMALKSGSMAYLRIDGDVVRKAGEFLDSVQTQSGAAYGYTGPGSGHATTAIGLLSRMYLGWKHDEPALRRGVEQIAHWQPSPNDMYYNYYAAQVMFQFTGAEGEMWEEWNEQMRSWLVNSQASEGHETGSWFMRHTHAGSGGRLYCTSLATMILEVYYRHMPIFQQMATDQEFRQ